MCKNEYKVGSTVYYNSVGVCEIIDKMERNFKGETMEYFVLKPLYHAGDTIYLPLKDELLDEKISPILTKEEVDALILKMKTTEAEWSASHKVREQEFKSAIKNHEHEEMIAIVISSYQQGEEKALSLADKHNLDYAEKMLSEEFACALGIPKEDVKEYIDKMLKE